MQEKGIHSVGFYVLIPHFHPSTQLDIDAIPGLHDIQETPLFPLDKASSKFLMDENNRYLARNNHLYLLGLLQSWKIYLNNQVALNYSAILDNGVLRNFILHLQENPEQHLEMLSNFEALQNSMRNHAAPEIIKSQVTQLIDSLQLKIYHTTLLRYQAEEMVYNKKRLLHYDGEFLAINSAQQANCLNFRHAKLVYQNNPESPEPKMMIGFKGRRHDLNLHERAAQKIEELRRLIQRQEGYLPRHWLALQRLSHILSAPTQPSDPERHIKKLASFAQAFHECKVAFDDPKNQAIHRFFRILGHALASFGSLGIYALIKAKQSQEQRGSWKFWKTHKEIFIEKAEAVSKYSAPVEMKLQY